MENKKRILRSIPKIDEVLQEECLFEYFENTPRELIVDAVRLTIDDFRAEVLASHEEDLIEMDKSQIMAEIIENIGDKKRKSLRRTINATGVVLHTNLGRAPISKAAAESVASVAVNYSTLEYDVKKGGRGSRHDHVEKIIKEITGAEAAMVVNNNAAATMICLSSMGYGKEVIVSRGELVEIGGSFRVPEIMSQSGAILKEIGTTNKTKIYDYEAAINDETAALMKIHTSNYKIMGFTEEASLEELVELGKAKGLPVIYDMGSGLMVDLQEYGVDEPTVKRCLDTGIDVILFSGDKLLGGPQGGIIAGKKEIIDAMKKHQLARVIRVDKMTLAAMEATFKEYISQESAMKNIPILRMLTDKHADLQAKAENFVSDMECKVDKFNFEIEETYGQVGGGSAPTVLLRSVGVAITSEVIAPSMLEGKLRKRELPIIGRISNNKFYIEMRTVSIEELEIIKEALLEIDGE